MASQTVSTELGDVELDDATQEPGAEETQQADDGGEQAGDGSEQQAGAKAEPAQKYKIGEAEYTQEELAQFIEDVKNAKAMRREADERYKEAKRMREDPEIAELDRIRQLIRANPQLRDEFMFIRDQWLKGRVASRRGATMAPIMERLQRFEQRFEEIDRMRDLESAKGSLNAFLEMHNKIPGAPQWTQESPEFVEFFEQFEANTSPNDTDIEAYFWKKHGPELLSSIAQSARGAGKAEVEEKIKAGRRASATTTQPSGQRGAAFEPDMSRPDLNSEIEAALGDTALMAQLQNR